MKSKSIDNKNEGRVFRTGIENPKIVYYHLDEPSQEHIHKMLKDKNKHLKLLKK